MRYRVLAVVCCATALPLAGCQSMDAFGGAEPDVRWDWTSFGRQPMGPGDSVDVASLSGGDEQVVIHGVVTSVCQEKGCWMTLRDDNGQEIFVRFEGEAFVLPHGVAGRNAVIHGSVERRLASVEELRQCAEDSNKRPGEINAITQPTPRLTFYADTVLIAGEALNQR